MNALTVLLKQQKKIVVYLMSSCVNWAFFVLSGPRVRHKEPNLHKNELNTVASKKTGRQNHALTQWKILHCKMVVNIITYHHVV
jgi:hypothetical protein